MSRLYILFLLLLIFATGCAVEKSVVPPVASGECINSLEANIAISFSSPQKSGSVSGVLNYAPPTFMKFVILNPFGSVMQEAWISGNKITLIDPANESAFVGALDQLPSEGLLNAWRLVPWVLDFSQSNTTSCRWGTPNSFKEKVTIEKGVTVRKELESGEFVQYGDYTVIRGIALPREIILYTPQHQKFKLVLDDIDVDLKSNNMKWSPDLKDKKVYPLSLLNPD